MATKFLKGCIGLDSAEGSSYSPVAALCLALTKGQLAPEVLFTNAPDKLFVRGDTVMVMRDRRGRPASRPRRELITHVRTENGEVVYITDHGGPIFAHQCALAFKASQLELDRCDQIDANKDCACGCDTEE